MGLYPPLETTGANHRLQYIAEVKFRLEKERDRRASLYKKYRRGVNIVDGVDTTFSMASVGLAADSIIVLSTIVAAPISVGIQTGSLACGLLSAAGKLIGRKLQTKAKTHDEIRILAEAKINSIADRISVALNDDKISEEEFRLILSEIDKFNEMKKEIRCRVAKQGIGLSEAEKKQLLQRGRDEAMATARTKLLEDLKAGETGTSP